MNKNYLKIITICILGMLFGQNAHAQCTETNLSLGSNGAVGGHSIIGQTFTASCAGNIQSISIAFVNAPSGASSGRYLNIRDGALNTSSIIHSQAIAHSSLMIGTNVISITSPVAINNGESNYFEILDSTGTTSSVEGISYAFNNYAGGSAWFTSSNLNSYDIQFEVSICSPSSSIDVQEACVSYEWIDGVTYTASNNTATHTLTNALGCDSVITLNLTINPALDLTLNLSGLTLTSNETGATYQWLDCNNGNAIILGENSQSFTAQSSGNYAVEITKGNCTAVSDCQVVSNVAINKIAEYDFNVFPNPSLGLLNVNLKNLEDNTYVKIFNAIGNEVYFQKISNKEVQIDLLNQSKGLYFLKIYNENVSKTVRVLLK